MSGPIWTARNQISPGEIFFGAHKMLYFVVSENVPFMQDQKAEQYHLECNNEILVWNENYS